MSVRHLSPSDPIHAHQTSQDQALAALDDAVMRAIADGEAGKTVPADAVFNRLQAKYAALTLARLMK